MSLRLVLASALLLTCMGRATAAEIPDTSVYQLHAQLTDQDGRATTLDVHRGRPTLVTMFYASCPNVCPMLIASMRRMEQQLPPDSRERLRVLLVSLDPERDTPAALKVLAERYRVDAHRWTFARAQDGDVRKLAAVLGIRYRKLPDGEFNHSTVITLLDASGRIVTTTSKLSPVDAAFQERLSQVLAPSP